jgi:hypothetical protein
VIGIRLAEGFLITPEKLAQFDRWNAANAWSIEAVK